MRVDAIPGAPVVVADADDTDRAGLSRVLEGAGFEVVPVASGDEALEAARRRQPCAVLLEVTLPTLSGYEVCRALRDELGWDLPIVFVSGARTESYDRVAGFLVGADDYLVKPYAPDELLVRLRRLLRRAALAAAPSLTQREREVLALLADGCSQKEIAERLFISSKTVGTHIEHILKKLGARDRAQVVAFAYRDALLHENR
jgi:DNA-binding NarL/FixJ family response regulator